MKLSGEKIPAERLPFPTSMAFEPVQLCNASCFCCPYSWLKNDKEYLGKKMTRDQIELLLRDFASCRVTHSYEGPLRINPFRYSDPLVCKDLDFILSLCVELKIRCAVTTNAVSFNDKTVDLLTRYFDAVGKISISVIGSNKEQVQRLMGVDLDRTLSFLESAVKRAPQLRKKIRVNLRKMSGDAQEVAQLQNLAERFRAMLKRDPYVRDEYWLSNRVDKNPTTFSPDGVSCPETRPRVRQDANAFVVGCPKNIRERIEVMQNGDVVLCCDDAERAKVFGNAFTEGIAKIWNGTLAEEHSLLYSKVFQDKKNSLICSSCSRAAWNNIEV